MIFTAGSSRANRKEENQDSYSIINYTVSGLPIIALTVADGISRGDSSRWYADAAIQSFHGRLASFLSMNFNAAENLETLLEDFLNGLLIKINDDVLRQAILLEKGSGGSTLSAAIIVGDNLVLTLNAGDSPIFVIRNGNKIKPLYTSGKMVDIKVRQGTMTYGSPDYNRQSNRLTYYIGAPALDETSCHKFILQDGDNLVLGSDGAFDNLNDTDIADILTSTAVSERMCNRLFDLSSNAGSYDNQTVIVCGYSEDEPVTEKKKKSFWGKEKK